MSKSEQEYINRILRNDESALKEIYCAYKVDFISFFRKYGSNSTELEDAFQDSIIALYQNVALKRLTKLDVSIKSYIWAIGKHKVIDMLRRKQKEVEITSDHITPLEIEYSPLNERQQLLYRHFKFLGKSCQEILKYFYYEGLTVQEIAEISKYKDVNTVKSSKSRCIKQLRNLIKNA